MPVEQQKSGSSSYSLFLKRPETTKTWAAFAFNNKSNVKRKYELQHSAVSTIVCIRMIILFMQFDDFEMNCVNSVIDFCIISKWTLRLQYIHVRADRCSTESKFTSFSFN